LELILRTPLKLVINILIFWADYPLMMTLFWFILIGLWKDDFKNFEGVWMSGSNNDTEK
jgi:hypothetical protein